MAITRNEILALNVQDNSYTSTFDFNSTMESESSGFTDAVTLGLAASVVSGGVGIINTALSVGSMFGADVEQLKTEDVLQSWDWDATNDYYQDNREIVDAVGFGLSTIVPGLGGLKAAKYATAAAKASQSKNLMAVGLRRILVPEDQIAKATAEIAADTMHVANRSNIMKGSIRSGFHTAAVESAFAETAILLSTNQHVTVNSEQLGYFEAVWSQRWGAAVGFGLGTGIGGVVNAAVTSRAVNRLVEGTQADQNVLFKEMQNLDSRTNRIGFVQGNKIVELSARYKTAVDSFNDLGAGDLAEFTRREKEFLTDLREEIGVFTGEAGKALDAVGRRELEGHLTGSILNLIHKGTAKEVAEMFHSATSIGKYTDKDFLFDPVAQPLMVANSIDDFKRELGSALFGRDYSDAVLAANPTAKQLAMIKEVASDAAMSRGISVSTAIPQFRKNIINRSLIDDAGLSVNDTRHILGTIRHEIGHGNTVFKAPAFMPYLEEAETLSRIQRPAMWKGVDRNRQEIASIQAKGSLTPTDAQRIASLEADNVYAESPLEMLADAWAQYNAKDPLMRGAANKLAPALRTIMENNSALKTRLGHSERLVSLKNGKIYEESAWAPTIADRGLPRLNGQTVSAGDTSYKINADKFSILTASPDEASAYYFAAHSSKVPLKKEVAVMWDNFYMLNRLQQGMASKGWAGKATITMPDGSVQIFDNVLDGAQIDNFTKTYRELKSHAATVMNSREVNKRNLTYSEIGRVIDTDEDFAMAVGNDPKSVAFWSSEVDPTKPTVAKVFYKTPEDFDESTTSALADSIAQNQKVLSVVNESIDAILHTIDNLVTEGGSASKLTQIAPDPAWMTSAGGGGMTDVTRYSKLLGALSTFQGKYGESTSIIQAIAKFNEVFKLKGNEHIQYLMTNAAQKVSSAPEAVMELNVLDSKLRQNFYKFAPTVTNGTELLAHLTQKINIATTPVAAANIDRLLKSATGAKLASKLLNTNQLWTRETEALLGKIVNQKRYMSVNETQLNEMLDSGVISIKNKSVAEFWQARILANKMTVDAKRVAAGSRGFASTLDDGVLYPGKIDPTKYKHRMYVIPTEPGVWNHAQKGIIGASTPAELAQKEAQVRKAFGNKVNIVTKEEMEASLKDSGDFLEEFSLNEYQLNSDMKRKGVNWDVAPEANAGLVAHYIRDAAADWSGTVDNLTELKYAQEFAALQQGDSVAQHYGTVGAGKQQAIGSSFREAQSIMLNRASKENGKQWRDAQQSLDQTLTKVFSGLNSMFRSAEKSGNYEDMSRYMDHYGLPKVYEGQTGEMLRTSLQLTDQALASIVPKMNGIAATLMLRLDYVQPMVNALSMPVMSVPELNALMKSVPVLQRQQIAKGLNVTVPGTDFTMGTNLKLQMQAVKDFHGPEGKKILERYYQQGIVTNLVREMRQVADDITIDTSWTAESMKAKVGNAATRAANFLGKPADIAEDFVKFVAARQAELVLDAAGITDASIRSATLRTYTTRVHGNYVHAQRPAIFQGFAGQAIGLFQTYQFNLIQSLLGKVGDKNKTAVASMMGIQAGMFGAQSVPGFRALNEYIALKSEEGTDFYTGTQDILGDETSEWVLFGVASNFTKPLFGAANALGGWNMKEEGLELFTRGDLNPRSLTLLPTSLEEIPALSMSTKFLGSILGAARDLSQGVDAGQVMADTLAHNGVNRPLAGLGAIWAGARTTNQGSLIANLSDLSWFAKAARTAGTKTLDEAIAVQSFYRTKGFDTIRNDKLQDLGRGAKRMIQSGDYDPDTYNDFFTEYASKGGRPEQFNKWMHQQALGATESTIQQLYKQNNSASGRYLQDIMGNDIDSYISTDYNPNPVAPQEVQPLPDEGQF
jgi:hypothetical protein